MFFYERSIAKDYLYHTHATRSEIAYQSIKSSYIIWFYLLHCVNPKFLSHVVETTFIIIKVKLLESGNDAIVEIFFVGSNNES